MCNLPHELVEIILVRLPVKSLKRFQCVAQSWCSLIKRKSFVQRHLRWSLHKNSNHRLILKDGDTVLSMDLDGLNNTQHINLPFPCKSVYGFSNSCNGLVLVKSDPPILWNPFTTEFKVLSVRPERYQRPTIYTESMYGFGYDYEKDDYKVVRVVRNKSQTLRTEIYSLKSDSWRQIQNFPYFLPPGSLHVHVNGALHTIVDLEPGLASIVAYSVVTETQYKLKLPPCNNAPTTLGDLGKRLSVTSYHQSHFDIWVMNHYGVAESWTKLISIAQPSFNPFVTVKPLVLSISGDRLLLSCDERKLLWCDWRNKTVEYVPSREGLPYKFRAEGCVESFVSLSEQKQVTSLYPLKKEQQHLAIKFGDFAPVQTTLINELHSVTSVRHKDL